LTIVTQGLFIYIAHYDISVNV